MMKKLVLILLMAMIARSGMSCSCAGEYNSNFMENIYPGMAICQAQLIEVDSMSDEFGYQEVSGLFLVIDSLGNFPSHVNDTIRIIGGNGANCGVSIEALSESHSVLMAVTSWTQDEDETGEEYPEYSVSSCNKHYRTMGGIMSENLKEQIRMRLMVAHISDERTAVDIRVYPNPTWDRVFLKSEFTVDRVKVFNMSGELMPVAFEEGELDLSGFPPGLYMIRVDSRGRVLSHKVVKK